MRTGAIFARGSCRALKWMALFGVVFALGAGQAVAQKPNKPVLTAVEGVTSTSVKLKWTVPGGGPAIESFVTQTSITGGADFVATAEGTPVVPPSGPTTREATITTGVTADTRTTYRVGAVNDAGTTWSNVRHFTTENAPPAPVLGATPTIGDGQVTLTWTQPAASPGSSGAPDYYEYNYKPGNADTAFEADGADARRWARVPGGSGARRQVVSGLTNGTSYVFGIRAVNRGGPTPADSRVAATPAGEPGAPTGLMVTRGTPSAGKVDVTLAWTEPESDGGRPIDYYEYQIDGFRTWTPTTDASTFFVVTGLDADMAAGYTYRVRAVNAIGAGPDVGSDGTTGGPGPGGPAQPVTPKSTTDIMDAVEAAKMAADSDGDGRWTPEDDPAIVPLAALFNGLPEMFDAEAMSSTAHVQASILASSGLMRASNPAVALRPVSAGMADVTVTAAGVSAPLSDVTVASAPTGTGTGSSRNIVGVSVPGGSIREGGQAQATVTLNAPVEQGRIFKARLRLVGRWHTRERGIVTRHAASPPYRVVGGVRVPLTGELTDDDYDADVIGELTIQPGYSSGTVTIRTGTDLDAEDERLALQAVKDDGQQMFIPNSDASPRGRWGEAVFTVEDAHEQGYVLTAVPSKIYENGNSATVSTLHFTSNYERRNVPVLVTLTSSHPSYFASFTGGGNSRYLDWGGDGVKAEFQLAHARRLGCVCDGDRMDNEVVITATVTVNGVEEEVAETTVTVVDVHKLPKVTVTAMTVSGAGPLMQLAEGAKYKVRVEADRNDPSGEVTGETVTVSLALGDDSTAVAEDYRITPSSRRITGGLNDQSATFDLEVLGGDGDIGEETLVLDAMVKGGATHGGGAENKGMLSVALVDTTTLNVEPRSDTEVELAVVKARNAAEGADDLWTYGDDDLSIKLGDLFKLPADGFTVTADAVSADAKVVTAQADAGMVTVTAVGMGTTMVTVTATTAASGVQISPDIASVEFEVEVDELTRVFMVSGPDDMMNLVEGGEGAMVTVSTNIPVSENTEVMLMRDGSSSAGDDDYMLEPSLVTIMAGEMTGSTMVTATEDNMAEEMEMLTLFLVVDDMQMTDKSVSFYLWDAAVPALPVIAQLLLAAFLAIGGCRRYLRR